MNFETKIKHYNHAWEEVLNAELYKLAEGDAEFYSKYYDTESKKNLPEAIRYAIKVGATLHYNPDIDEAPWISDAEMFDLIVQYFKDDTIPAYPEKKPEPPKPTPQPKATKKEKAAPKEDAPTPQPMSVLTTSNFDDDEL